MALEQRYTDEHAKAGLDFAFPAIETWENQFPGYEILIDDPVYAAGKMPGVEVAEGVLVQLPEPGDLSGEYCEPGAGGCGEGY